MSSTETVQSRYGMIIDLDACVGCGACMVACAIENNIPPATPGMTERTALTSMRVEAVRGPDEDAEGSFFLPIMCQQCSSEPPCVTVCPQNAVEIDPSSGIVYQMPQRCLGCRYCMAACPYHARMFNWWDPEWPQGMEKELNPRVSVRSRGVAEKCNFCHGRLQVARAKAIAEGADPDKPVEYIPACVEACPVKAIVFGDLNDASSEAAQLAGDDDSFQMLPRLGTEPNVFYRSSRNWVRQYLQRSTGSA